MLFKREFVRNAVISGAAVALISCVPVREDADLAELQAKDPELSNGETSPKVLNDDALRLLLSDAHATSPRDPEINISHPWGETFDARGVYFKIEGRTRREGVFEIRNGMVCVEGPSIDRRCRNVVPNAAGTYTFIDSADGSREVLVVTPR